MRTTASTGPLHTLSSPNLMSDETQTIELDSTLQPIADSLDSLTLLRRGYDDAVSE